MNPTVSIVAYISIMILTILSVIQAIKNNLRVLPENGDLILLSTIFSISLLFPGYWLWGVLAGSLLNLGLALGINKGWWRVILLVPLVACFLLFGGLTLPTYWWR